MNVTDRYKNDTLSHQYIRIVGYQPEDRGKEPGPPPRGGSGLCSKTKTFTIKEIKECFYRASDRAYECGEDGPDWCLLKEELEREVGER